MSTIAVDQITDNSGGNTTVINGVTPNVHNTMGRNRIINGDMRIDQRNNGASVNLSTSETYIVDRFWFQANISSGTTGQRSSVAPAGFTNSILVTVGTGASPTGNDFGRLVQKIEGFNVADFGWGTANAQPVTISFWVRSSITGTFGVGFTNNAQDRKYVGAYTVSSANTLEYKTITVPGDTSGTWLRENGTGLLVGFDLGEGPNRSTAAGSWSAAGSYGLTGGTKILATSGATFYITGVQLEAGSVATPFERVPYGTQLALCQRYYWRISGPDATERVVTMGIQATATILTAPIKLAQTMRAIPTVSAGNMRASDQVSWTVDASLSGQLMNVDMGRVSFTHASNGAQYRPAFLVTQSTSAFMAFEAEL